MTDKWKDENVSVSVFRFIEELSTNSKLTRRNNRNDRVSYIESSPSSVLFFRSITSIFYSYLTHVATERDSRPKQVRSHLFSNS